MEKFKFILVGMLLMVMVFFLMGAGGTSAGRYRVSAWSATEVGFGAYVIDTETGETRVAYQYTGATGNNVDNLGLPFSEMKPPVQQTRNY